MNLYLPALTDEELIRYADSYAETPLERALLERLKLSIERNENA